MDHVRPFSRGGPTVPRNLQLAYKSRNSSRSAPSMAERAEGG